MGNRAESVAQASIARFRSSRGWAHVGEVRCTVGGSDLQDQQAKNRPGSKVFVRTGY